MAYEMDVRARTLVLDAMKRGGDLWEHVSPATVEALIRGVVYDLMDQADVATRAWGTTTCDPNRSERSDSK